MSMHEVLITLMYLVSAGLVVIALRSRFRFGPNYSIARVRTIGVCFALTGVLEAGIALSEISATGRTFADILRLLTGFQFALAGAFFWYAATHRPFLRR